MEGFRKEFWMGVRKGFTNGLMEGFRKGFSKEIRKRLTKELCDRIKNRIKKVTRIFNKNDLTKPLLMWTMHEWQIAELKNQ
jgi:hypothetical protein